MILPGKPVLFGKDLAFYVKWTATFLTLIHVALISYDVTPAYKVTGLTIGLLWLLLGYLWREPSVVILNFILSVIYCIGLFK
jgi:hypothetical protein